MTRYLDAMPAWVARQRSRRLVRHSDEKVVRWISHGHAGREEATASQPAQDVSSNDNVVAFSTGRSAQAF